jgi:hypothetical protein
LSTKPAYRETEQTKSHHPVELSIMDADGRNRRVLRVIERSSTARMVPRRSNARNQRRNVTARRATSGRPVSASGKRQRRTPPLALQCMDSVVVSRRQPVGLHSRASPRRLEVHSRN